MHLDRRIGNAPRLHPTKAAARLRAGCAHPRSPSPSSFFATSPPSTPCYPLCLSLFLPISRNDLFSVCVPGVCTHPVQWHRAASSTLSSTLPAAGSGPRESSFIVSSCRITPSRRRTSRSRNRIVDFRNCPVDDTRSLTR